MSAGVTRPSNERHIRPPDVLLNTQNSPDSAQSTWYLVYSKPRQEFIAAEQLNS